MAIEAAHWRFTVHDYHKMAEVGILCEDDPVELIDGEVVQMSPVGNRHVAAVNRTHDVLLRRLPVGSAIISTQNPVRLDEHSEPQPDVAVLRFQTEPINGRYADVGRAGRGQALASTVIDGLELRVDDVLG